jgi:transposase-like protein
VLDIDTHRCARTNRCPDREKTPEDIPRWVGAPIPDERGLCGSCSRTVQAAIRETPMDYVELHTLLAGSDVATLAEVVAGSQELPVPLDLGVEALQVAIWNEAQLWAEVVSERLRIDWDTRAAAHSRAGVTLQRACRILEHRVDVLVSLPLQVTRWSLTSDWVERDGLEGALEMLRLHDLVRSVAGRTELVHKLPAPCPSCDRLALIRANGSSTIECEACHRRWTEQDYERLCLVLAADEHLRIDACGVCDVNGVLPKQRGKAPARCDHAVLVG